MSKDRWRRVWTMERETKTRGTAYSIRWYDLDGRMRTQSVGHSKQHAEGERRRKEMELNYHLDAWGRTPQQCAAKGVEHVPVERTAGDGAAASDAPSRPAAARSPRSGDAPAGPLAGSDADGSGAGPGDGEHDRADRTKPAGGEEVLMRGELRFTLVRRNQPNGQGG